MTISYSNFFAPTVLGTSAGTLLTVPTSPSSSLLRGGRIRLTNTTATAATATLYAVPFSGTASASNAFLSSYSVPGNGYIDVDVPILPAGATVQALSGTASAITAHMVSGSLYS